MKVVDVGSKMTDDQFLTYVLNNLKSDFERLDGNSEFFKQCLDWRKWSFISLLKEAQGFGIDC